MTFWDILLLIVSCLLITIIMLQESSEDATNAFTGEKSDLFANKKGELVSVFLAVLILCYILAVLGLGIYGFIVILIAVIYAAIK